MIGAGQLARMTHEAGIPLGIKFRVLAGTTSDSASQVARNVVVGDYRSLSDLREFAGHCDVVTFDHEHVPPAHLEALQAARVILRPGPEALLLAQDKAVMRARLGAAGIPVPRWRKVSGEPDVAVLAAATGWPVVLKAVRGGYDGRGVWVVRSTAEARPLLRQGARLLVEEYVPFTRELSVLVARSPSGQAAVYPVVESVQVDGVCREVYAPAPGISPEHALAAQRAAVAIAGELHVTGLMAVELFDTPAGVLVNELAMRPHNTGHWSIEGARTSQFEQHLRAVLDLPLGETRMTTRHAAMVNVIGGSHPDMYPAYRHCMARDPGVKIHMYGKEVRKGRKVGHVTALGDDLADCQERARHAAAYLRGDITE